MVNAVVLEGRSYREVARAHGVSKSWVAKLVGRFRSGGWAAIEPHSRAPKRIPHRTPPELEDEIVALRKELTDLGVDAGAATIHYHLARRHEPVPSVSTIWRGWARLLEQHSVGKRHTGMHESDPTTRTRSPDTHEFEWRRQSRLAVCLVRRRDGDADEGTIRVRWLVRLIDGPIAAALAPTDAERDFLRLGGRTSR